MFPLHCWYDLQPSPKDMRNSQEHCRRVIWSSRWRFRNPKKCKIEVFRTLCGWRTFWRCPKLYLEELWPIWLQRWLAGRPACSEWSWGGWTCPVWCCRIRHRWCPAQWPLVVTAWWAPAEAWVWVPVPAPRAVEEDCALESSAAGLPFLFDAPSWFYGLSSEWGKFTIVKLYAFPLIEFYICYKSKLTFGDTVV